ncbi:MAG TPA: MFS transporter [Anaerolineales bacterium]|nr:MFS transporter [Anaerolineales bacterium]
MPPANRRLSGMLGFSVVMLGQIASMLATQMSTFALTIWVFERTGSATALGLVTVFFITPYLIITPMAGAMVDRYSRKLMMMVSDLAAGVATTGILVLHASGNLEVWHLYAAAILQGMGNAFQWPAFSATISIMVPREQYGRANGMMSVVQMGPGVIAPMMAGALLPWLGLTGILLVDVATFLSAIALLMLVHIPQPLQSEEGARARGRLLQEAVFGFRYIFARPSLLGLQLVFLFGNLGGGIAYTAIAPMVLLRTGNDSVSLGAVLSAGAVGGVLGGVLLSAWGGFKRRVHGVLGGWIAGSLLLSLVGVGTGLPLWVAAIGFSYLVGSLVDGSNQAIWQSKVAPDVQGRVFSARLMIAWLTNPVSPIIAGLLGDYVFEPAMRAPGGLAALFGGLVAPGPGAGMALLIVLGGCTGIAAGVAGYLSRHTRHAETILPDHQQPA